MVATRQRNTAAELELRRVLHAIGLRYRTDQRLLRGLTRRADIVFVSARVAVLVDGCFWHCCPLHGTRPKTNSEGWAQKLDGNILRDRDTDFQLTAAGWDVIRVWEHEAAAEAAARISARVKSSQHRLTAHVDRSIRL